jgi:PAS domain-containing protein
MQGYVAALESSRKAGRILSGVLVLLGLYLSSLYSYPLFHSLAEIFSIVVACSIFMIAWNTRESLENTYLLFIGIAYLFVASIDLIHTLAYKGMGVFPEYGANLPTQLWIAGRFMESFTLLIAPFFFDRKLRPTLVFLVYASVSLLIVLSIFYWDIFPDCFVDGVGLTPFKKVSEYIICLVLLASGVLLFKNRERFDRSVLHWVLWSIIVTIGSELAFTFYISAYGLSNLIGHFFKILSFYFIYKAIIETGLSKPYNLLLRNLKKSELALREQREWFRVTLTSIGDAVMTTDTAGRITFLNPVAVALWTMEWQCAAAWPKTGWVSSPKISSIPRIPAPSSSSPTAFRPMPAIRSWLRGSSSVRSLSVRGPAPIFRGRIWLS